MPDDGDVELTDRELAMARQLVESLAAEDFEPEKYHDEYREQVLDLIERKAAGEEIVAEPVVEPPAKVLDLVAALEASLEKAQTPRNATRASRPRSAQRSRPAKAGEEGGQEGAGQEAGGQEAQARSAYEASRFSSEPRRRTRAGSARTCVHLGDGRARARASSQPQPAHTGDPSPAARERRAGLERGC